MSRTKNSLRNVRFALILQAANILVSFITRKVFVQTLTQEYLGLNGTFSNILTMLSVAEMGIGSAITYSLYKPLAEEDRGQITALVVLYRRIYCVIGATILLLGAALTPFLSFLIRDLPDIPHIDLIYLLFVLDSGLSYFFVYKQSLIIADQRQYITTLCQYTLKILLLVLQALLLRLTGNYFVYLGLKLGTTLLGNLILAHIADVLYPYIRTRRSAEVRPETRAEIIKNTKALIFHNLGGVIVFGTDNLLISFFVGVVPVGLYSNYLMVTNGLNAVYSQLYQALTASVGNLGATSEGERVHTVFRRINFAGNWLYGFSSVCLTVLLNPFIELWIGKEYLFSQEIVCLISLSFYVTGMRQAVLTFRNAKGLYWYDRYKAIASAIANFAVSVALAIPFGIAGIILGTSVSTMMVCFWMEPLVLFKYGLHASAQFFFRDYAVNTAVTLVTTVVVWCVCAVLPGNGLVLFLEKMVVCAVVGNLFYLLAYHRREEFRYFTELFVSLVFYRGISISK